MENNITSWIMNPYIFRNMIFGEGNKEIKVYCKICGKEQWLSFSSYYKKFENYMCHHCSTHTDEFINRITNNNPMKNQRTKDKNSISQKEYYKNNPEAIKQKREDGRKMYNDPMKKAIHTLKLKEYYSGFKIRKYQSDIHKVWWINHPEERLLQSERAINQIHPPRSKKSREKYSESKKGDKNPAWKGGISLDSYCNLFNLPLKEAIRLYFNNNCFMDNEPEENERALSVHHVNYDKRCGCDATQFCIFVPVKAKWNIIFNGSKEHNRWYWYSFLMNKIFIEHPNYFAYHIPVWGMNELEYNYDYVFEKFRR